jgi:sarcosine dehydrogenase
MATCAMPAGVSEEWIKAGRYELVVAGERIAAQVWLEPMYDPGMVHPKG